MPTLEKRLEAIPFGSLIGAPLCAAIDAQAKAAVSSANFITTVGFTEPTYNAAGDDFGNLRMVTFLFDKADGGGVSRPHCIKVPVPSLLPIPALQIKDAELEYYVKIVDTPDPEKGKLKPDISEPTLLTESSNPTDDAAPQNMDNLQHGKKLEIKKRETTLREVKGMFSATPTERNRNDALNILIKIKLRMEQADIPAGLGRLFQIMEQGISMRPMENAKK